MYTSLDESTERTVFVQGSSKLDVTLFTLTSIYFIILKKKNRSACLQWQELRKFLKLLLNRPHDNNHNSKYGKSHCSKTSILVENEPFPWEPEIEKSFDPTTTRSGNDGEILLCTFITKQETTQEIELTNEEKMKEAKYLLQYKGTFHVSCPCCK